MFFKLFVLKIYIFVDEPLGLGLRTEDKARKSESTERQSNTGFDENKKYTISFTLLKENVFQKCSTFIFYFLKSSTSGFTAIHYLVLYSAAGSMLRTLNMQRISVLYEHGTQTIEKVVDPVRWAVGAPSLSFCSRIINITHLWL